MANNKIRGITIELGADTSGVTKALGSLNSSISQTSKELKDVEKLLKLDPSNVDLLRQKEELLANKTSDLSTKLKTLKESQEKCNTSTEEGKKAYDVLQREIVETTSQLEKAKKQQDNFNVSLEEFKAKANEVSKVSGQVASATKGISTAAGGAVAGLVAMAVNAGKTADDLNTLAKQSGFTTDEIQKWQYASDMVDVSTESIISAAKKLKNNMTSSSSSVTDAFEKLGVATTTASGEIRDSNEVFYEVLQALSQIENETERDVTAMAIFGKGADELAGIIDDGGASLQAYSDKAEELGLILSQDTLDGANELNDAIDTLKATATASFTKMGATIAEQLIPVAEDLLEGATKVLEFLTSIDGNTWTVILTIGSLVAAISPIAGIISGITAVAGVLQLTMLPTIGIIAGIIAGITALVLIIKNWGKITDWMSEKWEGFKDGVKKVIDKIKGFFNFEWSLPKLKLPHVSISGSFSLVPPKVPKFSIDWYAKAMDSGMIMNTPTIFGMNSNGQLMAGGERGSETIVGTNSLMSMIQQASSSSSDRLLQAIENGNVGVYIYGDTLVGRIAPNMNEALGTLALRGKR